MNVCFYFYRIGQNFKLKGERGDPPIPCLEKTLHIPLFLVHCIIKMHHMNEMDNVKIVAFYASYNMADERQLEFVKTLP